MLNNIRTCNYRSVASCKVVKSLKLYRNRLHGYNYVASFYAY